MSRRAPLRLALGTALVVLCLALPPAAQAESTRNEAMFGAGSALASLVYGPTKLLYAAGGSVVAGLAWLWSGGDGDVVAPILTAAVRGDYVITPEHLRGERKVVFVGQRPEQRRLSEQLGGEVLYEDF